VDLRSERDADQLRRIAMAQQVQIEQLLKVLAQKCRELEALKGNPQELQQTLEFMEELTKKAQKAKDTAQAQAAEAGELKRKAREKFGPTAQPELELEPRLFELDAADRTCPSCGGQLEPMRGQFELSEMIDVVDVSYKLIKVQQQKYSCKCGGCIETAIGPERVTPGGRYSLDFGIKVVVDKYEDHIPLARQERILRRHSVVITSQALWDQVNAIARQLEPASNALLARALAEGVIGLDQTSWKRLEGKGKPWQMWCITTPNVICHRIRDDKGTDTFIDLVGNYEGIVVCDALKTHEAGAREIPGIKLAACWAHVFRKFEEAEPDHPEAGLAMKWIRELYDIDERAGDDLDRRAQLRSTESAAVLETLKTWLWSQAVLKTLSIGKAAAYAIANWERLSLFAHNPRIPLDNNATERAIRGPVVGRKNHYGSKSKRGTEAASALYSLIETAKLHGVNSQRYLREAVVASRRGEVLLPWQLAK
jgi:transposase